MDANTQLAPMAFDRLDLDALLQRYTRQEVLDIVEVGMYQKNAEGNTVECPLKHIFTPGLYSRQIFMPAGSVIVSKIHKTEHQYVILQGRVTVWTDDGWAELEAPHRGITKPGTRRLLIIHTDTIWATFHPATETTPEEVEARIIEPHTPALPPGFTFTEELQ